MSCKKNFLSGLVTKLENLIVFGKILWKISSNWWFQKKLLTDLTSTQTLKVCFTLSNIKTEWKALMVTDLPRAISIPLINTKECCLYFSQNLFFFTFFGDSDCSGVLRHFWKTNKKSGHKKQLFFLFCNNKLLGLRKLPVLGLLSLKKNGQNNFLHQFSFLI